MSTPIDAIDSAIASLAKSLESVPLRNQGTISHTVDKIEKLTAQRGELIRQQTSQWRDWTGAK